MLARIIYILFAVLSLTPWINAPIALLLGLLVAFVMGNPFVDFSKKASKKVLQWSIIGLGFGLQLNSAFEISKDAFWLTLGTIVFVFVSVYLFNKFFKLPVKTAKLIASGTAICGGSAIAAIAPTINAENKDISIAMGTVFILNAIALFLFPLIGKGLEMTDMQFGLWSAVAIHDTSSVVGAAQAYSEEALKLATTIKLSRALWIIPLTLLFSFLNKSQAKITVPYFIVGFILTMLIAYAFPAGEKVYDVVSSIAKQLLVLALFLIGSVMDIKDVKKAGSKSILLGSLVWILVSVLSLFLIMKFY